MSSVRIRPTFLCQSTLPAKRAITKVSAAVADRPDFLKGQFTDRHGLISIVDSKRHFWSPWLSIEANDADQGSEIRGRFSPHPTIWTAFMFTYLALAVLSFFSMIVGLSQQLAGELPWGYALIPVFLLMAVVPWIASQIGQNLADSEMAELRKMILECLSESST